MKRDNRVLEFWINYDGVLYETERNPHGEEKETYYFTARTQIKSERIRFWGPAPRRMFLKFMKN